MIKYKLEQDPEFKDMYRIRWSKDELSDMVNKTRAKEYIRQEVDKLSRTKATMPPRALEKPADAFVGGARYHPSFDEQNAPVRL